MDYGKYFTMRFSFGLLFISVSFFGTIFFRKYGGYTIPYPTLWYFLFLLIGLIGVWLIYTATKKLKKLTEGYIDFEKNKFKLSAEKIEIDIDKCEFKNGSFSHQVEDKNMSTVKLFAGGTIASSIDTTITENVIQSYLIYSENLVGNVYKFISQSFPFDPITLKFYVLNHSIELYVDRFDKSKYLFDLKR